MSKSNVIDLAAHVAATDAMNALKDHRAHWYPAARERMAFGLASVAYVSRGRGDDVVLLLSLAEAATIAEGLEMPDTATALRAGPPEGAVWAFVVLAEQCGVIALPLAGLG